MQGGFAAVYRAVLDGKLVVALKVLLPQHTEPGCLGCRMFLWETGCMRELGSKSTHRSVGGGDDAGRNHYAHVDASSRANGGLACTLLHAHDPFGGA